MNAHKLQAKLFLDPAAGRVPLESFIPVFHSWIKRRALPELLVDVANYAHVPKGPGVGVVGHASDYFLDESEGRPGLLTSRKREAPAPAERLSDLFRRALHAALLLERDPALAGKVRFRTDEILFRINDRLAAPSSEATFAEVRPALDALCTKLLPGGHRLALVGNARQLFSVQINAAAPADLETLLGRLGGPPG